jgi:hypothetical protein
MGMIGNSLSQGLISGANIQDGTVDTPDIKDGAVHTAKIADGAVTSDKLSADITVTGSFTSRGIDDNATSTAMTLDGSGKLLVGTTDTTPYNNSAGTSADQGFVVSDGRIYAATNANSVSILNRTSTDGDIVQFRKDGSTVGSIGSYSTSGIYLDAPSTLRFSQSGGASSTTRTLRFASFNNGSEGYFGPNNDADSDASIRLGTADGRWSDLYLSGGVYLGGTGSANKLDDYEEGTWTPTVRGHTTAGSYTYSENQGHYTKVGNLVTAWFNISNVTTVTTGSGTLRINNLPFSASWMSGFNGEGVGTLMISSFTGIDGAFVSPRVGENFDYILFYHTSGTNNLNSPVNITHKSDDGADLRGFVTYRTA